MSIEMRFAKALALISLLSLSACVLVNKFDKMETIVNGNDVAFTLPEKDLMDKDVKYMLLNIGVGLDECVKDCVGGWEMVRPVGSNTELVTENYVVFPIKYGVTLPNMQTREFHKLKPGNYVVSASFSVIKNGQVKTDKKVVGIFTIQ